MTSLPVLQNRITEIALDVAPEYPNIEDVDSIEQLYAIKSTIDGLELALKDCHTLIEEISERENLSKTEILQIWEELKDEGRVLEFRSKT